MNREKSGIILIGGLVTFLFLSICTAYAESVTFKGEHRYQASKADNRLSCQAIALEQVKMLLLGELATYLESETEAKNYQLTKDQIKTLATGLVHTEIVDEKWDGKQYWLKAKIMAEPHKVAKLIGALRRDCQKFKLLEEARKRAEQTLQEVEKLNNELILIRDKSVTRKVKQYYETIDELIATGWFEKGYTFNISNTWEKAMYSYSMAIRLDPNFIAAYNGRGLAYMEKGNYDRAIIDFTKVVSIDPHNALAYDARGLAYMKKGSYDKAITNFSRAIEVDPRYPLAYINRATVYLDLEEYRKAIMDCTEAIEADSGYARAYSSRGWAYYGLEEYYEAIKDHTKAIDLDPYDASAYKGRAWAFISMGVEKKGCADLRTACSLGECKSLWEANKLRVCYSRF